MVGKVRWLYQAQKAGHAGTLDPLATGILPIALGEATKTVPFMMDAAKSYEFTITWGANTTTQDVEGEITLQSDVRPSEADILAALPEFRGIIEQVPPKFSAIKVDGKRAYDLARAGEAVELKSRPARIDRFDLVAVTADTASFEVDCGKGTYIRSLARDLAASLDACGRPVVTALDDIPALAVTDNDKDFLKQGRAILLPPDFDYGTSEWVLTKLGEIPIALCIPREGQLVPKRVFNM